MIFYSLHVLAALALSGIAQAREVPARPDIKPSPLQPYKAIPTGSPRTKTCFVKPSCTKGRDDSAKILAAFHECNNGGTVVLDEEYTICSPLDLRFLKHVDVALTGTVKFCDDDLDAWVEKTFKFPFQEGSSWWLWGGDDINLYGLNKGTIDGNGQKWYDTVAERKILRPLLFVTDGWHGGSITGLKLRNSPNVSHTARAIFRLLTISSGIISLLTAPTSSFLISISTRDQRLRTRLRTWMAGIPTALITLSSKIRISNMTMTVYRSSQTAPTLLFKAWFVTHRMVFLLDLWPNTLVWSILSRTCISTTTPSAMLLIVLVSRSGPARTPSRSQTGLVVEVLVTFAM